MRGASLRPIERNDAYFAIETVFLFAPFELVVRLFFAYRNDDIINWVSFPLTDNFFQTSKYLLVSGFVGALNGRRSGVVLRVDRRASFDQQSNATDEIAGAILSIVAGRCPMQRSLGREGEGRQT